MMVQETFTETRMDTSDYFQKVIEIREVMVTPTRGSSKYIIVARNVVLKNTCEKLVLVSRKVAGLIKIVPSENGAKNHACMTA